MSAPTQVEQSVLEQISAELREAGRDMDAATLRWTRERFERLMDMAEAAGCTCHDASVCGSACRTRHHTGCPWEPDHAKSRRRTAEWQAERGCGGAS